MAKSTLRVLSEEQLLSYKLSGYIVVEDVLTPSEVKTLADQCDLIAAGKAGHIPESSIQLEKIFRDDKKPVENQVLSVRKLFNIAVHDPILW